MYVEVSLRALTGLIRLSLASTLLPLLPRAKRRRLWTSHCPYTLTPLPHKNSKPTPTPKPLAVFSPFRPMSGREKLTSIRIGSRLRVSGGCRRARDLRDLPVHDSQPDGYIGVAEHLRRVVRDVCACSQFRVGRIRFEGDKKERVDSRTHLGHIPSPSQRSRIHDPSPANQPSKAGQKRSTPIPRTFRLLANLERRAGPSRQLSSLGWSSARRGRDGRGVPWAIWRGATERK